MNLDLGVRNKEDLKDAYIMIKSLTDFIPEAKKTDKCREMIVKYKKAVREFNHKPDDGVRLVKDDGDSYVELIEFPDWMDYQDATQCFEEFHELIALPSQYDCTGQRFTMGTKFFMRRDHYFCYHSVGLDVQEVSA